MKRGRHYLHLLILLAAAAAGPVQAFNLRTWLDNPPYAGGGTAQEQIQCYALPYGAIGFSSHLLTYLTAFLLSIGRHPLLFWNRLKRRRFNIFVSAVGFCVSCPVTVLTMVRCRRTWPFILLAIWKLFLSATITIMAIHAANANREAPARRYPPSWSEQFQRIWWWVLLYFVGTVVGFVGLMDIVKNNMGTAGRLRAVTGAFGGITLFLVLLFVIGSMFEERDTNRRLNKEQGEPPRDRRGQIAELLSNFSIVMFLSFSVAMVAILFAFYTDWALAAVAGDLVGMPGGDNLLFYWLYFAAKRFPMLSC
ncbi:uncharacterized protein THITE_2039607 [Thermothielavioides terrestris NRRL 8126]|uniref:Uncharacterized protein n=1 Tax=Thermothielavioides terrestris (strain ATCC 38088 / NRRL 8126) TaxID=578455 RepID=G2QW88_THETT|nr:uncharacterized protein THITE_2039607 [Thermothielavioides terrestris NRRL 8126]AEO63063.1 hypothetical protein THITE_2039607 [Thermothielavioides terrestris NRRL 8126]